MKYDIKYRRLVIEYWNDGNSKRKTAALFNISASTLQKWKSQLKKTGTLEDEKRKTPWRKINPEKLQEYIKRNPDAYLKEIAEEFNCSDVAVIKALRRLKISRKKNHSIPGNEHIFAECFS